MVDCRSCPVLAYIGGSAPRGCAKQAAADVWQKSTGYESTTGRDSQGRQAEFMARI
jgi:hypothetical protein